MLTRDQLTDDLQRFRQQKSQLAADMNAVSGAIQYIEGLLKTVGDVPPAVPPPPPADDKKE